MSNQQRRIGLFLVLLCMMVSAGCKAHVLVDSSSAGEESEDLTDKYTESEAIQAGDVCYMFVEGRSYDSSGKEDIASRSVNIAIGSDRVAVGPCTSRSIADSKPISFSAIPGLKWLETDPAMFEAADWAAFMRKADSFFPEICQAAEHGAETKGVPLASFHVTDILWLRAENRFVFALRYEGTAEGRHHDWLLEVRVPRRSQGARGPDLAQLQPVACNVDFGG